MLKIAYALAALVLAYAALYVAADRWGRTRLDAYEERWRIRLAEERARAAAVVMPALEGSASLENAAPLEAVIFERLQRVPAAEREALRRLSLWKLGAPWPDDADAIAAAGKADVDEIRAALAHRRCDWEHVYDPGAPAPAPRVRLQGAQAAFHRLLIAGHERANAGDAPAAARRYAAAIRLGADLSQGSLVEQMVGNSGIRYALDALARLVARDGAGEHVALIETTVPALMAAVPPPAAALRGERLHAGALIPTLRTSGLGKLMEEVADVRGLVAAVLGHALPARAIVADALARIEEHHDDIEAAVALPARASRDGAYDAIERGARASWNPILRVMGYNHAKISESLHATQARAALLMLAIDLERRRAPGATLPPTLAQDALPVDPSAAPARLSCAPTANGRGWRIWSAGMNGVDEGASGDDIVYERAAR